MNALNLGCGPDYREGWVNYDLKPIGDVCGDCEQGLPFQDGSFDFVLASHLFEHIHDLRGLKKEIRRIIKRGGTLVVITPYYLSPDAWGDDTHCRAFSRQSFAIRDFWPGWDLLELQSEDRVKLATKEKITWMVAKYTAL